MTLGEFAGEADGRVPSGPQMVQRFARTARERIRIDGGGPCEVANERCEDHVGGAMEEEASERLVKGRAEHGRPFHVRHLAFESWDAIVRVMTGKRMELLHDVRRHKVSSVRAPAKALGRDYSNVHADVQALTAAGLLNTSVGAERHRRTVDSGASS